MKIRIHRGTKEIGGTCIEIEAQGKRIALDVGLPLDAPDDTGAHEDLLPQVPGFREPDASLLGVLISHPHMDHYGLARYIRPEVPVYIGESAHNVYPKRHLLMERIVERPQELFVDENPRLNVFGFDGDQKNGSYWKPHLQKLRDEIGDKRVLLKGDSKEFTTGISTDYLCR